MVSSAADWDFRRYVFRFVQMLFLAFAVSTLFPKPRMDYDSVAGGSVLMGAIFFSLLQFLFDGVASLLPHLLTPASLAC